MADVSESGKETIQSNDGKMKIGLTGNDINLTVPIDGEDRFKLSNDEFKVSQEGIDVDSATDRQSIVNKTNNTFKIVDSNSVTTIVSSIASGGVNTTTIPHNLGIAPAFLTYVTLPNNLPSNYLPLGIVNVPAIAMARDSGGNGVYLLWVSARADTTNLYIDVVNPTSGTITGPYTFIFRYYILYETAN